MYSTIIGLAAVATVTLLTSSFSVSAAEGPVCGMNNGQKATGEPILVGGINGNAPPGDFSGGTDGAGAYFRCVNDNGGINGRPIKYIVENDQWNPMQAACSVPSSSTANFSAPMPEGSGP